MKVAIIGGGAAGCFCAINLKRLRPEADVTIYEAGRRALAKVAVTGGGRCNLTNTFREVGDLRWVYPRGDKLMRRALMRFSERDTWEWFEAEGVRLVAQADECVFPQSQDAMQIVRTLTENIRRLGIQLLCSHKVERIVPKAGGGYELHFAQSGKQTANHSSLTPSASADYVLVCSGGHPSAKGLAMLRELDIKTIAPVPSLFTLNIAGDWKQELMGTVVQDATVTLASTKFRSRGALLLTHWGMSGPAILRLTSYAARHLAENAYRGELLVNWFGEATEEDVRATLRRFKRDFPARQITNEHPAQLTARHWNYLTAKSHIAPTLRWGALNQKEENRLVTMLTADPYTVTGRCPFKEEFVTCGGVALSEINLNTLEAKRHPGLFFAGEVLDVDAVTGGFNLQAAWSMGYVVATHLNDLKDL